MLSPEPSAPVVSSGASATDSAVVSTGAAVLSPEDCSSFPESQPVIHAIVSSMAAVTRDAVFFFTLLPPFGLHRNSNHCRTDQPVTQQIALLEYLADLVAFKVAVVHLLDGVVHLGVEGFAQCSNLCNAQLFKCFLNLCEGKLHTFFASFKKLISKCPLQLFDRFTYMWLRRIQNLRSLTQTPCIHTYNKEL